MRTYVIKRLLLMIPTFFAISLIVFLILNLAPGRPGGMAMGAEQAESADTSGSKREAYRIFKQQFNLNKPVIFNTRFALATKEIQRYLAAIVYKNVSSRELIKAQDNLEDYGVYAVPHLVSIMNDSSDPKLRDMAVIILTQNVPRQVISRYAESLSDVEKKLNREIDQERIMLKQWIYRFDDPEEKKREIIGKWKTWYEQNNDRYNYSFGEKLKIFFIDTRFAKYWSNLINFDFGVSHIDKQPVLKKILSKLKYSLSLSVTSLLLAYLISVPLGVFSAVKQNTVYDRIISVILFMLYSLPSFFVASLLLTTISEGSDFGWKLFPTGGFQSRTYMSMTTIDQAKDIIWHLILPVICLTYGSLASLSRYARSGLLEVIRSDYIRTARAKGLSEFQVILKHAVRNGMIPILTLLGTILPVVLGGSVIIEVIFGIDGMGLLAYKAILYRDYNVIMGVQLISAFLVLIGILISDFSYALVDPRITFK
ncbi:MAG: ABC transporter permease [bacterium]|nr:ABC transporter permease [bacterium]